MSYFPEKYKVGKSGVEAYHQAFRLIGNERSIKVLCFLADGPKRYSDIARYLEKTPDRTLSDVLRKLRKNGLVSRQLFTEVPVRVEYELTDFGRTLIPVLQPVLSWIEENFVHMAGEQIKLDSQVY